MSTKKTRSIEIPITAESFETAIEFIDRCLKKMHARKETALETKLVFESLFDDLMQQGFDKDTVLSIKPHYSFGEFSFKLGFEGKAYVPNDSVDNLSPELKIVQAYNDKVDFRYRLGYNSIRVIVKRNYRSSLMHCIIGILLAILAYIPISLYMSMDAQSSLEQLYISPLIKQFANAMMMIGAPVTFFSMIKNLTDIYIVSEKSTSGRKLQIKTIITSLIAVFLAIGTSFVIASMVSGSERTLSGGLHGGEIVLSELLSSIVPKSILEPFNTYLPFPLILSALLVTYAFCSAGKYFDMMQKAINVCFTLFSKILKVIIFTLPFFCFLAILLALIEGGFESLFVLAEFGGLVILSLVVMAAFYLIRLLIGRVKIGPFLRHLPLLIWENFKINSAIDAVPFNIRYCKKNYGYDRKRLSQQLPILAETNQDGNCFILVMISMLFILLLGENVSWIHIIGVAILILFLSFGAPNQPGSVLIGMLIVTTFLQADEMISIAIYAEVFFGALQNIVNVIGDIVTVAIEEQKFVSGEKANKQIPA